MQLRTRDPLEALDELYRDHGRHHVFFEGGPTLAAAFLKAGVVDEVLAYVAPMLLGDGTSRRRRPDISTISRGAPARRRRRHGPAARAATTRTSALTLTADRSEEDS